MKKMKLQVYDPPMCCSSGVCGPSVDTQLVRFSSDLNWLKTQNVEVERYNLSSHPGAFASQDSVKKALEAEGSECLPLILVNGSIVSKGVYPSREILMGFLDPESEGMASAKENAGTGLKVPGQDQTVPTAAAKHENDMACGPGCDCNKPSGNMKARVAVCLIALLAICGIFVYKAMGAKQSAPANTVNAFAAPIAKQTSGQEAAAASVDGKKKIGELLDSLGSLNNLAMNKDTVFIFIPAKGEEATTKTTFGAIQSAIKTLESKGLRIGLYTLRSSSPEYPDIAKQLPLPGMLILSKGRGMGTVSGEMTETSLLQAFITSQRAGGCGSGCGPSAPGCQ